MNASLCERISSSLCQIERVALPCTRQLDTSYRRRGTQIRFLPVSQRGVSFTVFQNRNAGQPGESPPWKNLIVKGTTKISASSALAGPADVDESLYEVLGVEKTADRAELKRAYRRLAKDYHPDVNTSPDAQEKFVALSSAYEVLIDEEQRALYDKYGLAGLKGRANKSQGAAWSVWDDTWDEFKPHKRKSRKGDAREAAAAGASSPVSDDVAAVAGDVVEYPLSQAVMSRLDDGRTRGVGFIVSRNLDRGDKHKLPVELLELVELEPLYREPGMEEWIADPLESAHFTMLSQVRRLRSEYNRAKDSWLILDELSPGCGSPEYAEEVIL